MAIVTFMEEMPVKKIKLILLMAMVVVFLSGCSKPLLKNDAQNDHAAEYIAGIMLKHSKNYNNALIYETPEPVAEDTTKEEETTKEETTKNPEKDNNKDPNHNSQNNDKNNSNVATDTNMNFNEFFKSYNINVAYKAHKFYDTYPENVNDQVYNLSAGKGKKLLVVEFVVKNKSDKKIELDLLKENLVYSLQVDGKESYKPLLSVLSIDDLQFIQKTFNKGESCDALLIFEVTDKAAEKNKEMYITVSKDGKNKAKQDLK